MRPVHPELGPELGIVSKGGYDAEQVLRLRQIHNTLALVPWMQKEGVVMKNPFHRRSKFGKNIVRHAINMQEHAALTISAEVLYKLARLSRENNTDILAYMELTPEIVEGLA